MLCLCTQAQIRFRDPEQVFLRPTGRYARPISLLITLMNRIVWLLAASYVALGTGLFDGLAIDSATVSLTAAAMLALLAVPQRLLLSLTRGGRRRPRPERAPRNDS